FLDDRLCRNCAKLDLEEVFDPNRFNRLPPIGSAQIDLSVICFNLAHYPMAEKEKTIRAIPASLHYNLAALDKGISGQELSTVASVFLLIMKPSNYKTFFAQYYSNTRSSGGGLTAWIRFTHREAPGSLVSVASTAILEPLQPLLNIPMQVRVLREEKIDFGLI
ncbi:hypothetical protein LX36DRAFT_530048, partial [Colletotrichum falcatum]